MYPKENINSNGFGKMLHRALDNNYQSKVTRTIIREYLFKNGNCVYEIDGKYYADIKFSTIVKDKINNCVDLLWYLASFTKISDFSTSNYKSFIKRNKLVPIYN